MPSLDADANANLPFSHAEWLVTPLAFLPTAINDSGLIVGSQNDHAVQFQNGHVEVLLEAGVGRFFAAIDVSSKGAIVGTADGGAVLWFPLPLVLPHAPIGFWVPSAINKDLAIVGTSGDAVPQVAFKWTPADGFAELRPGRVVHPTFATDVNDHGYAVGFIEQVVGGKSPLLWTPDSVPQIPWPGASILSRHPRINNRGDVALIDRLGNVSVLHLDGTIELFPSIPDPQSVDGISDEGRLIGTSKVSGAIRGWTFYKNQLHWLDPPQSDAGGFVQPTGVNTCGNIVGQVIKNFTAARGVVFTKQFPFRCDEAVIVRS